MLKYYICRDGEAVTVKDCLSRCRLNNRCMPTALLELLYREQEEKLGTYSVTELCQPTRIAYLKRKHDYGIDPRVELQAIMTGIVFHKAFQNAISIEGQKEERFEKNLNGYVIKGRPDIIIDDGSIISSMFSGKTVIDYKTTSYKRLKRILFETPEEWIWQGRFYDYLTDYSVNHIVFWAISVDHAGEEKVVIPRAEPVKVEDELKRRVDLLHQALENNKLPTVCEDRYQNDMRCKQYCFVKEFCPYYTNVVKPTLPQVLPVRKKNVVYIRWQDEPEFCQRVNDVYIGGMVLNDEKRKMEYEKSIIKARFENDPNASIIVENPDGLKFKVCLLKRNKTSYNIKKLPKELLEQIKSIEPSLVLSIRPVKEEEEQ